MSDDTTSPSASGAADNGSTGVILSGATTYRGRRIQQLQAEIAELETAVAAVLSTGKSYALSNSHSVTRADVADIQAELAAKKSLLASLLTNRAYQPLRREPTKFY